MQRCVRKGESMAAGDCSENCLRILVMSCKINVIFTDKTPWVFTENEEERESEMSILQCTGYKGNRLQTC